MDCIMRDVLGKEAGGGHDGGAKGLIGIDVGGGAIHILLQTDAERRKIEGVGDDAQQKLLPAEAQVSIGAGSKAQDLGLVLDREDGNASGALDLILPPADQALMMCGREVLQP